MKRRDFLARLSGLAVAGAAASLIQPQALRAAEGAMPRKKMNVLFIAVDDLRPQLGCYGHKQMVTPNLDRLASEGAVFLSAYCQQAVCSPTRSSLLTGCRPDTTKVYDLVTHFRTALPDVVTLPQHFKNNGYHSVGISKIFHDGYNDPPSWSEPWIRDTGRGYALEENFEKLINADLPAQAAATAQPQGKKGKGQGKNGKKGKKKAALLRGTPFECADVPDNTYSDGNTAEQAAQILKRIKDKPFFFACGFRRPHLPFNAPKKYWDLYDPAKIDLADNPFAPKGCPEIALTNFGELRNYHGVPKGNEPLPEELQRKLIHGYYAATSYVDAQIGKVLKALDDEGLRESTIVVLWGDHGWQLGEHGLWCKHTNFEAATHVPLLMRAPGKPAGARVTGLTEFVDIYPTLCELAGLPLPSHLEGTSFAPLLSEPGRKWKKAAFSQYPRPGHMGYSMRTERYRYTEWRKNDGSGADAFELYDYEKDPGENVNLAAGEGHAALRKEMAAMMQAGWRAAKPL